MLMFPFKLVTLLITKGISNQGKAQAAWGEIINFMCGWKSNFPS